MDAREWEVVTAFQQFMREVVDHAQAEQADGQPLLVDAVTEHLGMPPDRLATVRLDVPNHQWVNLDIAMETIVAAHGGGQIIGIGGGDQRHHQTLGDLLSRRGSWGARVGAVDRARVETGPHTSREVTTMGLHLFSYHGSPVAALQRRANPQYGNACGLEVVADSAVSEDLLSEIRRVMVERSVFRGQVLSFGLTDEMYGPSAGGIAFLERPEVAADAVILPEGALDRIERHVAGAARHRETLLAAGQHLKRGVLIYGPPGTGKTHTVRYLMGRLPGVTTVVLAGNALGLVAQATQLAQALQPAMVVMEDVDLIAEHREYHGGPQPLLFTLLDAIDGLVSEADVAFVLTTNRPDLLETALSQRPGRVDLAVEVPKPDRAARRRLLLVYAGQLGLSDPLLDEVAGRTSGVTASFFKELARRAVLDAAEGGVPVSDDLVRSTLDDMLDESQQLTRALLGSASNRDEAGDGMGFLRGERTVVAPGRVNPL
ncbi:MAG: ATP-binding protein [Nocardioides sp.]